MAKTGEELRKELKELGVETEEKNVPKLNKMLKDALAAKGGDAPGITHTVSEEDLERRPDLIETGANVGDELEFDSKEEYEQFLEAPGVESAQERAPRVGPRKGNFDIVRNGTFLVRTVFGGDLGGKKASAEDVAKALIAKADASNLSKPVEQREFLTMIPSEKIVEVELSYTHTKIIDTGRRTPFTVTERVKYSAETHGDDWKEIVLNEAHQWPSSRIIVTKKLA